MVHALLIKTDSFFPLIRSRYTLLYNFGKMEWTTMTLKLHKRVATAYKLMVFSILFYTFLFIYFICTGFVNNRSYLLNRITIASVSRFWVTATTAYQDCPSRGPTMHDALWKWVLTWSLAFLILLRITWNVSRIYLFQYRYLSYTMDFHFIS